MYTLLHGEIFFFYMGYKGNMVYTYSQLLYTNAKKNSSPLFLLQLFKEVGCLQHLREW